MVPDGLGWDDDGNGAPDPYAELRLDGETVARTETLTDTFVPGWETPMLATLSADSQLIMAVIDDDGDTREIIEQIILGPLTSIIRQDGFRATLEDESVSEFSITIDAQPN